MQDGLWQTYTPNGIIIQEGTYLMGKEEGKHILRYISGNKKEEATFKDGKLNGTRTAWYDNGKKEGEGTWKDVKQDGLWT